MRQDQLVGHSKVFVAVAADMDAVVVDTGAVVVGDYDNHRYFGLGLDSDFGFDFVLDIPGLGFDSDPDFDLGSDFGLDLDILGPGLDSDFGLGGCYCTVGARGLGTVVCDAMDFVVVSVGVVQVDE